MTLSDNDADPIIVVIRKVQRGWTVKGRSGHAQKRATKKKRPQKRPGSKRKGSDVESSQASYELNFGCDGDECDEEEDSQGDNGDAWQDMSQLTMSQFSSMEYSPPLLTCDPPSQKRKKGGQSETTTKMIH